MCRHVQWCNTVTLSRPLLAPALQLTPLVTGHQPANISEIRYWYCDIDTDLDVDTLDISTDFIVYRSSGLLQGHTFIFPAAAALYSRFLSHQVNRETFNTDDIYFRSCVEWMYEMFTLRPHMSAIWCYQCRILSLQITLIYNYNSFNW